MNVEGTASGQDVAERRQSEVRSAATIFILKIFFLRWESHWQVYCSESLTSSVIMVGQREVRCWGDMRRISTRKQRNTWLMMVGTCAKRRLSASRSNKQNPENFSFKNEHQNAR